VQNVAAQAMRLAAAGIITQIQVLEI